jgi:preprotein translocase subunit YajC
MTRRDKQLLKYIVGFLIFVLTIVSAFYILFYEEKHKELKTVLYSTKTKSGRAIFYKEINGEIYTVTQEELEILLQDENVEVKEK